MIDSTEYWRRWCPYCNSPNVHDVALITKTEVLRLNERHRAQEFREFTSAGHVQCNNCMRVFYRYKVRWAYDRKAMRRDYVRLGKLLGKGGKG